MRLFRSVVLCCAAGGLLAACTGPAYLHLNPKPGSNELGKPTRIIRRIVCELSATRNDSKGRFDGYVAAAQISLKVEDTGGLTPSLSAIDTTGMITKTLNIGGEITKGRLRTFTQNFVINIDKATCPTEIVGTDLTGSLGLEEVVRAALDAIDGAPAGTGGAVIGWKGEAGSPYFGSTIQFSLKTGANGGPSITKPKFKGYGGNNGLLNISRTNTDLLTIAFAPIKQPAALPPSAAEKALQTPLALDASEEEKIARKKAEAELMDQNRAAAINAAQKLLDRLIVQNLVPGGL